MTSTLKLNTFSLLLINDPVDNHANNFNNVHIVSRHVTRKCIFLRDPLMGVSAIEMSVLGRNVI